jgi:uncharacterized protein YciI
MGRAQSFGIVEEIQRIFYSALAKVAPRHGQAEYSSRTTLLLPCFLPMYLLLLKYKVPIEQVERVSPAHREFLDKGYKAEKLLVSGPRVPRTGGVILPRVKTRAEVDELIQADPFYTENIADYEVVEFQAMKFDPAVEKLQ